MCDLSDLNRGTNRLSYSHLIGHTQQDFLIYDVVVLTVIPKLTLHFGKHLATHGFHVEDTEFQRTI